MYFSTVQSLNVKILKKNNVKYKNFKMYFRKFMFFYNVNWHWNGRVIVGKMHYLVYRFLLLSSYLNNNSAFSLLHSFPDPSQRSWITIGSLYILQTLKNLLSHLCFCSEYSFNKFKQKGTKLRSKHTGGKKYLKLLEFYNMELIIQNKLSRKLVNWKSIFNQQTAE